MPCLISNFRSKGCRPIANLGQQFDLAVKAMINKTLGDPQPGGNIVDCRTVIALIKEQLTCGIEYLGSTELNHFIFDIADLGHCLPRLFVTARV